MTSQQQTPSPTPPSGNWLSSLLSAGNGTQKLLVALIVISGGGNFLQTRNAEQVATGEMDRTIAEVHDLHGALNEALNRQKRLEDSLERVKGDLGELLKRTKPAT